MTSKTIDGNIPHDIVIVGTTNQITATTNDSKVTLATPQDIAATSHPTFDAVTLGGTSNQLIINGENKLNINFEAPGSSYTLTVPNTNANSSVVVTNLAWQQVIYIDRHLQSIVGSGHDHNASSEWP
jgi:hypothetical protein